MMTSTVPYKQQVLLGLFAKVEAELHEPAADRQSKVVPGHTDSLVLENEHARVLVCLEAELELVRPLCPMPKKSNT